MDRGSIPVLKQVVKSVWYRSGKQHITGELGESTLMDIIDTLVNMFMVNMIRPVKVDITTPYIDIVFDTSYPEGSDYIIIPFCYNSYGEVGYNISLRTLTGFRVTPVENCIFECVCEKIAGNLTTNIAGKIYTPAGATNIVFSTPLPQGTQYNILPFCSDNNGKVAFTITNRTEAGFTVTPVAASTFEYKIILL